MPWYFRYFTQFKMDKEGDDKGGGGGGKTDPVPDLGKDIQALKDQNAELAKKLAALEKTDPKDEPDLAAKAKAERDKKAQSDGDSKKLEAAIRFNVGAKDWLKTNEALLPKSVASIFEMADKETYDSPIEKDCAIKVGVISEFFALQANVDLLTPTQKSALEEFQKLTKTVKQERAQSLYDNLFEPTFEMLKRLEKAKQISAGHATPSDTESAYKQRLIDGSKKHYLGDKK